MECYRDQREREEREREQFAFNVANSGADVVGLAGAFAGAVGAYNNYKNLKNQCNKAKKELAGKQKELAEVKRQRKLQIEENQILREKAQNLIIQTAQKMRDYYQKILHEFIYPFVKPSINSLNKLLDERGITLSTDKYIVQLKEIVAGCTKILCERAGVNQDNMNFMVFLAKKTETIQHIISMGNCPSLARFINNSAIAVVNNYGINYFCEEITVFFSMFTPKEIAAGYPSNETFSWANEKQIDYIVGDLIPCYGQRIVLFGDNLKYLNEYQVTMLTPQQTQSIKNKRFNFPQNSPIYEYHSTYGRERDCSNQNVPELEICQYHPTYGRGRDYSNQNVPELEEDSNCCLLI